MPIAVCGECEWTYRSADDSTACSRAMIDHVLETDHSPVERVDYDSPLAGRTSNVE